MGVAGVASVAAINAPSDTDFYACVRVPKGHVRMVSSTDTCKKNEYLIHWTSGAPAGLEGLEGDPCSYDGVSGANVRVHIDDANGAIRLACETPTLPITP